MAKLRKAVAWRRLERPYTRKSKYRAKQFVRAFPHIKIVKFEHGDKKKDYGLHLQLIAKDNLQVRHQAMESVRITVNRHLERNIGKNQYFFRLRIYPHHVLRENPLAAGAGADRMSTGMKKSFGKAVGAAAQVRTGKVICEAFVQKDALEKAKTAISKGSKKLAGSYRVLVEEHTGNVEQTV